jgi:hypothetical protein
MYVTINITIVQQVLDSAVDVDGSTLMKDTKKLSKNREKDSLIKKNVSITANYYPRI